MAVFEKAKEATDQEVIVNLLTTLAENPEATQRDLAAEMGVSLGMMVSYIKSCVRKGFIRSKQVAPRRWAYFVTPKGFSEKSKMVSNHLYRAMTFFRDTRLQLDDLFAQCLVQGYRRIAMIGGGDVAEIAMLVSDALPLELQLVQCDNDDMASLKQFDAVLVTDIVNPQGVFDELKEHIEEERLLSIPVLCIVRKRVITAQQLKHNKG